MKMHAWYRFHPISLQDSSYENTFTVLPAKSDSDVMFCLQSY